MTPGDLATSKWDSGAPVFQNPDAYSNFIDGDQVGRLLDPSVCVVLAMQTILNYRWVFVLTSRGQLGWCSQHDLSSVP